MGGFWQSTNIVSNGLQNWLTENNKAIFGSGKYKEKKKNIKENNFLMFGCPMKNIKKKSNIIQTN